jgi:protein SCO1/2
MKANLKIGVAILFITCLLFGCSTQSTPEGQTDQNAQDQTDVSDLNWQVWDFNYTNQEGKPLGLKDLKGKVWIADLVFTRCPDVCPPMTANMASLQKALKNEGLDIQFVSFSVDPEYDKPEVLKKFADEHGADFSNWNFLTGYTTEEIKKHALETFKGNVEKLPSSSPDVVLINHPTQFYLVNQEGKIVTFYDGLKPDINKVITDVKKLTNK